MRSRGILLALLLGCLAVTSSTLAQEQQEGVERTWYPAASWPGPEAAAFLGDEWKVREDMVVLLDFVGWGAEGAPTAAVYQAGARIRLGISRPGAHGFVSTGVAFDPGYLFIMGMPVGVRLPADERHEIDYRFENEKIIFEGVPVGPGLFYIEMEVCSRKLRNRSGLTIKDKLKQARTIRRIRARTTSWSPLAPGQIIAQETLRPIVSHAGYDTLGTKTAVVWANGGKLTGEFQLLDAAKNRQHPAAQPVVYTGKLTEAGLHIWGGNCYLADFTDFKEPGLYFVRLVIEETKEVTDSVAFPIRRGRYLELARKAADWFTCQRCGTEVPGFHKACHTKDAVVKLDGTVVDVTGGWHDAGDYGKWIWGGSVGIFGLTAFQDEFAGELTAVVGGVPRYVDEAAWEARYFVKSYWDGAFHAGFTPDFEDVCTWLGAPENEPPRVVTEAQCLELNYGITKGPATCLTAAALARVGRLVAPYDQELAKKCLSVARDVYDRYHAIDLTKPENEKWRGTNLYYLQSGLLHVALELRDVTGDEKFSLDAVRRAKNILDLQDEKGFFYNDQTRTTETSRTGTHLPALLEFLRRNPESELAGGIREAFRRWADHVLELGNRSPFGQIGGKAKDGTPRNIKPNTNNGRFGEQAWALAVAARLTKEPKYLKAAEEQLQWILGRNPADISMMAGVGRGPGCYHTRYCFMDGCEDGVVPGGITLGIVPGAGKTIDLGDTDTKNWVISDAPIDYPLIDTDVWGWTYAYRTSEYALAKGASFLRAAGQIEMALRELR